MTVTGDHLQATLPVAHALGILKVDDKLVILESDEQTQQAGDIDTQMKAAEPARINPDAIEWKVARAQSTQSGFKQAWQASETAQMRLGLTGLEQQTAVQTRSFQPGVAHARSVQPGLAQVGWLDDVNIETYSLSARPSGVVCSVVDTAHSSPRPIDHLVALTMIAEGAVCAVTGPYIDNAVQHAEPAVLKMVLQSLAVATHMKAEQKARLVRLVGSQGLTLASKDHIQVITAGPCVFVSDQNGGKRYDQTS
ncbi:hypothetical protein ABBQ38_006298 [Trebouxia sp. C0009 RCD-2024]